MVQGIESASGNYAVKSVCDCPKCKDARKAQEAPKTQEQKEKLQRQLDAFAFLAQSLVSRNRGESDAQYEARVDKVKDIMIDSLEKAESERFPEG